MRHTSLQQNTVAFHPASARAMLFLSLFTAVLTSHAQQYTKGVGIYPGDPKENFSPSFKMDSVHYRNLALYRPAYQSGAYDYNLTAQLITDGIIDTVLPGWIVMTTSSDGVLNRDGREHVIDRHSSSVQNFEGANAWLQVEMAGVYDIPYVDSLSLSGNVVIDTLLSPRHWEITISGSDDAEKWNELAKASGDSLPGESALANLVKRFSIDLKKAPPEQMGFIRRFAPANRRIFQYAFKLDKPAHYRYYRLNANNPIAKTWSISDLGMCRDGIAAPVGGPYHFTSAWKSAGSGQQWVYVDLGAICSFNKIKLDWIRPAQSGSVQVSDDASNWTIIAPLPETAEKGVDIPLNREAKGRYVRILMAKPVSAADGYILSELQVMGKGGPVPVAHVQEAIKKDGRLDLAGGAWKLQRASLVGDNGIALSGPGFDDNNWLIATVPATILTSYVNDGALPDPNFGDNQFLISDSYFYSDFWYRNTFTAPASYKGRKMHLNFDGINWEAEVYLNGHDLGRIDGAFIRGEFDVTGILIPGGKNVLAVRIVKNDTPGFPTEQNRTSTDANGGELGADNPTFHASIGWDWIPTIRGRNTGIWNDVYLSQSSSVTIIDPFVSSKLPLPDTGYAEMSVEATLHNKDTKTVKGKLRGMIGSISFEQSVTLNASETKTIKLNSSTNPVLKIDHPRLWWPNGYGDQHLYDVRLSFVADDGDVSDSRAFKTGIREMSYSEKGGALRIFVNGRRLVPFGGNWGFGEDMLRYRGREYDIAVRYHKEMNFTMIRNWVGQIGDESFYEACDRYGIMVWQDFWLANPGDGPDPIHPEMFIKNMEDFVKKIRNHASIGIYVGRNEGNPPPVIESAIDSSLPKLHPGIKYIPNSAFGTVSGGGPYGLNPLKSYFQNNRALTTLHSEMGMPDVVTYESFREMMPVSDIWPQSSDWGLHDFTLQGAQRGGDFNKAMEKAFGQIDNVNQWLSLAHWTEYQGYRAMFEAEAKYRMGLLLWMSHPAWPSLTWQTYDYYLEPTAAYFACKKACEPLHIQWNPLTDSIEVVNYCVPDGSGLAASVQVLNTAGMVKFKTESTVDCPQDSMIRVFKFTKPSGPGDVYFVKLELKRGDKIISENTYLRGASTDSSWGLGELKSLLDLPKVRLVSDTKVSRQNGKWLLTTVLTNHSGSPAFNVRLKVVGDKSGKRILPVMYDDNYFTLLPGEQKAVTMELQNEDTRGEQPAVAVEGFNLDR
jgi:hypothetical protein